MVLAIGVLVMAQQASAVVTDLQASTEPLELTLGHMFGADESLEPPAALRSPHPHPHPRTAQEDAVYFASTTSTACRRPRT